MNGFTDEQCSAGLESFSVNSGELYSSDSDNDLIY